MKRGTAIAALIVWVALSANGSPGDDGPAYPKVSGAYRAMTHWFASRAYPAHDIPRDKISRGYEFSRAVLRRPLPEAFNIAPGQGSGWQPLGPTNGGGRTLTVAFDPSNPNTIYAGSAGGGLWRSTTGGVGSAAWDRVETGFPVMGVSTIAFDPADSDVIYIGTGEVYNYQAAGNRAADRGTRGSYGIGILKSTDGGASWVKSLDWSYNQQHGVWAVRVDPTNSSVVWAATTEGVYKSIDAGQGWTLKHAVIMAMDLVVHPTNPQIALVGCGNLSSPGRGIYRTTDGGDTWTQITGGGVPTDFAGKIQFGVTPDDADVVYASVGNGFVIFGPDNFTWLLRSTDFGASWQLRSTEDYSRWQGWYSHDVAVDPTNSNRIITAGIDVWKSTNGGPNLSKQSSWQNYFTGVLNPGDPEGLDDYSHADHHDVVYHPTDPDIIYFANDGGVSRSLDGGQTFEGVNGGLQTQQFYNGFTSYSTDPDLAMGGLQDFGTAIYRGPGQWQRWVFGGDGGWGAIDSSDPDTIYATAQSLYVGKSTNGGVGFSVISPPSLGGPVAFMAPLIISPTDPDVLYAASSYLFKTLDAGGQWLVGGGGAPVDGNPILVLAVAQNNDDVLYLASAPFAGRGRVHRTTNGGATFDDVTGILPDRYPGDLTVDPTNEATVYLTMSGFGSSHVFRSTDYGDTWVDIDGGGLPDVPTTAVVVDPQFPGHVYVGNDIGVYFTADDGANWVQLDLGLPEAILIGDLSISIVDRKIRAATHGQGLFERELLGGDFSGAVPDGNLVAGFQLMIGKELNHEIELIWGASCSVNDDDYAIYSGTLGSFASHTSLFCSTAGATTKIVNPGLDGRYFLVVPRSIAREGSYGVSSSNFPRPPGSSPCAPQLVGACATP